MEILEINGFKIIQYKKLYRWLATVGIFFSVLLFIIFLSTLNLGDFSGYMLATVFFGGIIIVLQSIIVWKIILDPENKSVSFRKTFYTKIITAQQIHTWTMLRFSNDNLQASLGKSRYFECALKDGSTYFYRLEATKSSVPLAMVSDKYYEEMFSKVLGQPKETSYLSSRSLKSVLYDYTFLLY